MPLSVPRVRITIGRVPPSFSTAPASGSSSGTLSACERKVVIFIGCPLCLEPLHPGVLRRQVDRRRGRVPELARIGGVERAAMAAGEEEEEGGKDNASFETWPPVPQDDGI